MKPNSVIKLCKIPELSPDYANTWRFDNEGSQQRYFNLKSVMDAEKYTYLRKDNAIKVGYHIDDLKGINYLFYRNDRNGGTGKYYYCFILRKDYINEQTTMLTIKTDLLQTYQFDFDVKPSYVERCHVDRWLSNGLPTNEIEPEGIEFGENIEHDERVITPFQDSFIITTSNPLGKIEFRKDKLGQGDDGEDDGLCGDWENGIIGSQGFRMIKGFEGYAPREYYDTIGKVMTIGYGVTEPSERDAYNYLKSKGGATEEDCAKVSYYLKNERYGKKILKKCIEMGIDKQCEFDAMVSFAYNLGIYIFDKPGSSIVEAIKYHKNDEAYVRKAFLKYTNGGVPGLVARRNAECDLFFNHPQTPRPIPIVKDMHTIIGTVTENKGNGWMPCEGGTVIPGKTYEAEGHIWQYPTTGTVTSLYGERVHPITGAVKKHHGIDIAKSQGTPIVAPRDGTVEVANWGETAGNWVIIHHDDINMKTVYMHCHQLMCRAGDKVKQGQQIATQGTTGKYPDGRPSSTGVHLHFELRVPPFRRTDTVSPIQKPNPKVGDTIQ